MKNYFLAIGYWKGEKNSTQSVVLSARNLQDCNGTLKVNGFVAYTIISEKEAMHIINSDDRIEIFEKLKKKVPIRHLSLITDFFTYEGDFIMDEFKDYKKSEDVKMERYKPIYKLNEAKKIDWDAIKKDVLIELRTTSIHDGIWNPIRRSIEQYKHLNKQSAWKEIQNDLADVNFGVGRTREANKIVMLVFKKVISGKYNL